MGTLYDTIKARQTQTTVKPTVAQGVISPVQRLSTYKGIQPKPVSFAPKAPQATPTEQTGGLYERIKQNVQRKQEMSSRQSNADILFPISQSTPMSTRTSTPSFATKDAPTVQSGALKVAKVIGQETARSIASAALTVAKKVNPNVTDFKPEDFQSYFNQALVENVFTSEPNKAIEDRIVEAEPKIRAWGKKLQELAKTENLTPRERITVQTLADISEKNPTALAFTGIMGMVGLDLSGVGGLEKNALRSMVNVKTLDDAGKLLRGFGVQEDLVTQFAPDVMKVSNDKDAKSLFESIAKLQESTKATTPQNNLVGKADEMGGDSLMEEAKKYKSAEEFVRKYAVEESYDMTPGVTRLADTSETGLYHGAGTINLKSILSDGRLRAGVSKMDNLGEKTLSASGNRSVANSYGVVFELDDTLPKRIAPRDAIKGDVYDAFEYRIDADVPLSKVKNVTIPLNKGEGLETKILWNYPGKTPEYITAKELAKQFEAKGIKVIFNDGSNLTKSQLTDIYNKAQASSKSLPIPEGLPQIRAKAPVYKDEGELSTKIPTNAQIDELSKRVNELAKVGKQAIMKNIDEFTTQVAIIEDFLGEMPGRELNRYVSRSTGDLPEITGKDTMQSLSGSGKIVKNSLFGRKGDEIMRDIYDGNVPGMDQVLKDLADYRNSREKLTDIKATIKENRTGVATIRKGERLTRIGMRQRKMQYRAVGDRYNLTDNELAKFRRGRDISSMEQDQFNNFIAEANKFGEITEKRTAAMTQLKATVAYKDLKKWENVAAAMDLPPVHQMDTEQLVNLEKILDAFNAGDEFLPVRMLQTIDNTKLKGAKTVREILEVLGKEKGLTAEMVAKIDTSERNRFFGDVTLARQHPFFERMIQVKNESFMKATARTIELSDEVSDLVTKARKSRPRSLVERAVPTDVNLVHWLEGDIETRAKLSETMTKAELKAAERMDEIFKEYYDYLVAKKADAKFSRFEDTYFPHVRRGFLETWKEDGLLKAFKEMKDVYAQDQKYMNILNEQTGEILPYEKWVGFQQYRTDNLVPTANAAKAFDSYVTVLEKARHLDEMIPEIMAYVHALSPRNLTERGVELDASLKKFTKEWLNANKGRHPKGFFEPGGGLDWSLRASTTFTRMIDLGFNFTTQLIAPLGEQSMTLTMLKPQAYTKALARRATADGKKLLENNRAFTGRTLFDELSKATNDIGDRFTGAMFGMFGVATRTANEIFLLGKVTEAELKSGVVSAKRLAELQLEMSKYRAIRGTESMMSKTSEMGAAMQYKTWAIPILRATFTNTKDLVKIIGEKGIATALSSNEGKELFYSIGLGAAIGGLFYSRYHELGDKKDRSYLEDLQYKAIRDSLSILGALDPTLWSSVRIMAFYEDLSQAILDMVTLDTYKTTGELKGPAQFARTLTPKVVKQIAAGFEGEEPPKASRSSKTLPTPAGLPKLPSAKTKLPTPPGLPKLP